MAHSRYIPTLYQGIKLSPEPASSSSIVRIGAQNNHQSGLFASRKRTFDEISGHDEESFARKHLATEASIHFRHKSDGPRSFLWRVLNDGLLLEVQCVDLVSERKHTHEESSLTYHIELPSAIVPACVAFADAEKTDALHVFALSSNNDLTSVTINKDLLLKSTVPKDVSTSTAFHTHQLSALSFRRPFKLVAVSALELILTLHDGGFLRLERSGEDQQWKETHFSEGGWKDSLYGLLPLKKQHVVRHGDIDLDASAVVSVTKSPDNNFIWTVTLDHTLTAWDQRSGKVVARRDLLGGAFEQDSRKKPPYIMPAEQGALMQLIPPSKATFVRVSSLFDEESQYHLAVYSPKERCFKIYCGAISSALARADSPVDGDTPRMYDFLDGHKLRLPFDDLLDTNLWRLADFHFRPGHRWEDSRLWVCVQSGASSKIFGLKFHLFNGNELDSEFEERWQHGWNITSESDAAEAEGPLLDESGQRDPTESWLSYLFYPGRFSDSSLETTLHIYRQRRKIVSSGTRDLQTATQPLQARLSAAISHDLDMPRTDSGKPDYRQYYERLQMQWSGLYSILKDLEKRRSDPIAMAVDDAHDLVWAIAADSISPLRVKDRIEMLMDNSRIDEDDARYEQICDDIKNPIITAEEDWDTMHILVAAQDFAASLPQTLRDVFESLALQIAFADASSAKDFFSAADIGPQVSDESYQSLERALEPVDGIGGLTDTVFNGALMLINNTHIRGSKTGVALNRYGSRAMITLAQQLIQRDKSRLLDLLALITFINNDFDHDNLDDAFNLDKIYFAIMKDLRQLALRHWLVSTICLEPSRDDVIRSTVFESLFIGDWDSHAPKDLDFCKRLTHWCRQWTFATFEDWHGFTANIFATLLKHRLYQLATEFERFLGQSPWVSYLQGRLYLATGRHEEAALLFSSVAEELSSKRKGDMDTAGLLTAEERSGIGAGQDQYLLHIGSLFEAQHLYAYTADFATQALSFIDERHIDRELHEIDKRKSVAESPLNQVADARAELKLLQVNAAWEEITSRLFNAQMLTGRFQQAFTTLTRMKRPDLKRSNLHRIVDAMLSHDCAELLLDLELDDELADEADSILAQLAKKSLITGTVKRAPQQILYAYRIRRSNYRGAAQILYEQLERLRYSQRKALHDPKEETLPEAYLVLINTLACCGEGEEWLLADPIPDVHAADARRKLVKLEDVRRQYVAELDRRSDLQHGRFPLISHEDADDAMDVL